MVKELIVEKAGFFPQKIFGLVIVWFLFILPYPIDVKGKEIQKKEFEITKYEINVTIPDTFDRIDVQVHLEMKVIESELPDCLNLSLCNNFIGVVPVGIRVRSKRDGVLHFKYQDSEIYIVLPESWSRRQMQEIEIDYSVRKSDTYSTDPYSTFAFEVSDTLCHINAAITRTDNWYPKIAGHLNDRLPEFQLVLDVPSKFDVMASGELKGVENNGTRKRFTWQNYPEITDRSLYFFAAEQKRVVKMYPDGFRIVMYVPENTIEENLQYISDVIHRSFLFFESRFGNVPGDEYKIMAFPYAY